MDDTDLDRLADNGGPHHSDPGDEQPDFEEDRTNEEVVASVFESPTSPELELIQGGKEDAKPELTDLHAMILAALDTNEVLYEQAPSRELSIVSTKLEEAEMWLVKLYTPEGGASA